MVEHVRGDGSDVLREMTAKSKLTDMKRAGRREDVRETLSINIGFLLVLASMFILGLDLFATNGVSSRSK